jgi:hypothetical protein
MPEPAPLCLLTFFLSISIPSNVRRLVGQADRSDGSSCARNAELERACAQKVL